MEGREPINLAFSIGLEADIANFVTHAKVDLQPGKTVVLYTDANREPENMHGSQYELKRLCHLVSQNWQLSAREIGQAAIANRLAQIYYRIILLTLEQK